MYVILQFICISKNNPVTMNSESGGAIRYGTGQNDTVKPHYSIFFGSDVRSFLVTTVIFFVLAKLCSDNFMIRKRKGDRHSDKVTGLELIPGPTPFPIKLIGNIHQLHPMRGRSEIFLVGKF